MYCIANIESVIDKIVAETAINSINLSPFSILPINIYEISAIMVRDIMHIIHQKCGQLVIFISMTIKILPKMMKNLFKMSY